ncbi:hypothetical protein C8F04DRAFT_994027 [Mycena alexandri]|uniref:Uncharacterized protein n=1 Tax=Mycena alexandri TaxID=1745969 RepID=A0AAD6TDC5_9AGAR|nr:hypothetical protein C8F04DRAFT_994027 [Mycena alexandri]
MFFLFLLVHLLSKKSTAAQILDPRASVDSCDDINNCRKRFDIIWGCLTTIFACTWVSLHPNVPPPDQSRLTLLWRKLRMMLVAVIAPELIVGFAARQFFISRSFSKEFGVPISHGFFFSMGGFVSHGGHPITTTKHVREPDSKYLSDIKKVKVSTIMDKSKGDALSKGVALAQGLWFTTQCLARWHQHLPITELEVATLAFAVVNIFIWSLWWKKPLEVEEPIPVGPADGEEVQPMASHLALWNKFFGVMVGGYGKDYDPILSTSVPTFWSSDYRGQGSLQRKAILIECLVGTIFGAIHCAAWNTLFPSADEMWMWRVCSLSVAAVPVIFGSPFHRKPDADLVTTIAWLGAPIYIISRLFLIILPFTTLRALPPGAFADVNWSVYIPHL